MINIDYYIEIKEKILKNEAYAIVKDYSKEHHKVITYYEIGKLLYEAGNKYGEKIIDEYSKKLIKEIGKKFNKRTLFRMRQFYNVFSNEKVSTAWTQLTWSHIRLLFKFNTNTINYYIKVILNQHISVRELENKIKTREYERLPEVTKNKIVNNSPLRVDDLIPNPIIIKRETIEDDLSEYVLKQMILNNIDSFLRQLGNSFSYIGNEYKIKIGNTYNYIDLLLYNIEYNCYVVVELKVTELKKEHIGQIQVYMNYIDDNLRNINQDKTIGIIICREDNKYIIKYCSDDRIISRTYEIV